MLLEFQGDALIEADEQGKTLLEYSLANDIPHIHECYGSARCSTCRVRIVSGGENLSERNEAELRIAKMKGWP
ncbi:MAG: (2Fe-2S)-binding protein, partial [Spirochaetales bacterium]|nr:(2Fe-2S)-binding protein [Spirochaetales bacterium]